MSVHISSREDYNDWLGRGFNVAHRFCYQEMCEVGDVIPKVRIAPIRKELYAYDGDEILYPSYAGKQFSDILGPYGMWSSIVHETAHYFKDSLMPSKNTKDKRSKMTDEEERWEEGVATRIQERFLINLSSKSFDINKEVGRYLRNFRSPEKIILKRLTPQLSVKLLAREIKNGIEKYTLFESPTFLDKMKSVVRQFDYIKNSREGWLVVRKISDKEFRKLLKDSEAYKKIN